jgi:hypothetical protein
MDRRAIVAAFLGLLAAGVPAGATVLDFEDLPAPLVVRTQFSPRGVLLDFAFLSKASQLDPATVARSGTQVLRGSDPGAGEFSPGPMVVRFTSPQSRVRLFAGGEIAAVGTLRAFDAAGDPVGPVDGPRNVAAKVFTTQFEVAVATPSIARVELFYENGGFEAIDDLELEGDPPAPPPPTPPVVQITRPVDGAEVDTTTIDIAGTVTGPGLLSPATIVIVERRPPGSTAPPFRSALELSGTGTDRTFALPAFGRLGLGPIQITVEAENTGGLEGSASVTITNLPQPIRDRFAAEGGVGQLGSFRFGVSAAGCQVAVYELGAIGVDGGGVTHVIRGANLLKWLALLGRFDGCPLGEEGDGPPGSRVQDFQGGRIYTSTRGTFVVPTVFVDAIGKRGEPAATGVPIADPTSSVGAMQTWLFQRFARLDRPEDLPSTLEIRGTPPTLWIERQEGDLDVPLALSPLARSLGRFPATIWESFPCQGTGGPCTVEQKSNEPLPNSPNAGDLFCGGSTYKPTLEGLACCPPEWAPIRGDRRVTSVFGAIRSAHLTDVDNGLTHETHNGTCPYLGEALAVGVVLNPLPAIGGAAAAEAYGLTCVSDYEFFVQPIGTQASTSPLPSLFGKSNTTNIKTEYEVFYAAVAHNFMGAPVEGDLVHTTGRWIIDCGHDTFKSELHPIFSYAKMGTHSSEIDVQTGIVRPLSFLDPGQQSTRADIWVTGWYPGGPGNAIEFDIFPPPRPTPDSTLTLVKPPDAEATQGDISVKFSFEPATTANHVHVTFTAPLRENVVTAAGEMKWEYGRRYLGKWYAFWGE